ncbi:hypothetical protein AC579_9271 [Pseudocercospora musae]|uniref:Uncharacterized protein n=1 Tax=Pseudocercospora musae TaxID=113226 RepID=A0A139IHY2_9PEZI|nr:hypothetical protein AC579_9271 [Pseudocercospora musae]
MLFHGIDTGHAEPPRPVDIPAALRNVGVPYYDQSRAYEVYLRYISGRYIDDKLTIRELQELCRHRRISLRNVPDIYPGPKSHPRVQESFRGLHSCLVELLEKSETATSFKGFLDLEPGMRLFKVYKMHFDESCESMGFASLLAPPPITL